MTHYKPITSLALLHKLEGQCISVCGHISNMPWQHLIGYFAGYPEIYYFDVADYQIVIYAKSPVHGQGSLTVYGKVVKLGGTSKRPGSKEIHTEYHLLVDHWEWVKDNHGRPPNADPLDLEEEPNPVPGT